MGCIFVPVGTKAKQKNKKVGTKRPQNKNKENEKRK